VDKPARFTVWAAAALLALVGLYLLSR